MPNKSVTFAHVSDSHIELAGPGGQSESLARFRMLLRELTAIAPYVDLVVHTGDVCGGGSPDAIGSRDAYLALKRELLSVPVPFYFVAGNHDNPTFLAEILPFGPLVPLGRDDAECCYTFTVGIMTGVVLNARKGVQPDGHLPVEQLEALEQVLISATVPVCVFLHYPPVSLGTEWADDILRVDNGDRLHALLRTHADKVCGVFFGHVHASIQRWLDGICYVSVGSTLHEFVLNPGNAPFAQPELAPICFNLISVSRDDLIVRPRVVSSL